MCIPLRLWADSMRLYTSMLHVVGAALYTEEGALSSNRKVVEYIPLEDLHENPANPPSRMDPSQTKGLVKSIRNDGLQYPILVSRRDADQYEVIDGHRRLAVYRADK